MLYQVQREEDGVTLKSIRYTAEYKQKSGTFRVYDRSTKERHEVKALELLTVSKLMRYEKSMDFSSELFSDLKTDVITLIRPPRMNVLGHFKYDFERKCLVDIVSGVPSQYRGLTTMVLVGLTRKGETMEICIAGAAKRDLEIPSKDGSNAKKIETLNNSDWIRLEPSEDITKIKSATGAAANVHLLEVKSVDRETESYIPAAKQLILGVKSIVEDRRISNVKKNLEEGKAHEKTLGELEDEMEESFEGKVPSKVSNNDGWEGAPEYDESMFAKEDIPYCEEPPAWEVKHESELTKKELEQKGRCVKEAMRRDNIPF